MNPFSSGTRMRDTIQAIRSCKTAAEERTVVRKECAAIRSAISENDQFYSHRNLAKLMFFHMLGYPTHFGQMECLKLIASPGFPEKRIGYLGLMLLLDERQEVLMLVTNSIKQDLNHTNQYIAGLALCALGNIGSAEMARDLSPEVERLLLFRDPNIRKKAALCSIRIIKKVPDLAENFINSAAALLKEKHHGVLLTGIRLCTDLSKVSTVALEHFKKKCIDDLVKVLRDLAHSPYAPEYDISGITDPFLQIRLLKLLCILGQGDAGASDAMNDILAQVATKTESNKNSGNAILYECAATIMSIEENVGLRVLAVNILGRFLSSRDNNIRYVALNMLMKAIVLDSQAVQRHRATLLECVKDSDASIRKRALELVCLLVNENNVKSLTKELVNYLKTSDPEFMGDLTEKICTIVEKFAPDKMWRIDQMLKVLSQAGNHVKDDVWHSLIVVITSAPNLHGYSVRSLYKAVQTAGEQETLVRVSVWCIGEYGGMLVRNAGGMLDVENPITVTEGDAVDVVETALGRHSLNLTTRAMCLVSLLKLSHRFPACSQRINDIICHYKGSFALELQLRAVEFNAVIEKHQNIRAALVERMPVHDEAISSGRTDSVASAVTTSHGALSKISVAKSTLTPLIDLIDLCSDDNAPAGGGSTDGNFLKDLLELDVSTDSSQGNTEAPKSGTDALLGPFPIGTLPARSSSSPLDHLLSQEKSSSTAVLGKLTSPSHLSQGSSSVGNSSVIDLLNVIGTRQSLPETKSPAYPAIVAFESSSLRITFDFSKEPGSPQTTLIEAHFINKSLNVYTKFLFQAAVPKYLQLHLDPASSSTLPASTDEYITQKLRITNSQHGKKPLIMRVRINYKVNSKDVTEEGQINNFPREL